MSAQNKVLSVKQLNKELRFLSTELFKRPGAKKIIEEALKSKPEKCFSQNDIGEMEELLHSLNKLPLNGVE